MADEVRLKDFFKAILRHWLVMVLSIILCVGSAICYYKYGMTKSYVSEASVMVVLSQGEDSDKIYDYNESLFLINTIALLVKQNIILSKVSETTNISTSELKKMINVTIFDSSLLLIISCESNTPEVAQNVTNRIVDCLIYECQVNENLDMIGNSLLKTSDAEIGEYTGTGIMFYIIGALFIGFIIGLGFVFLLEFFKKKHIEFKKLKLSKKIVEKKMEYL